jgi:predicted nucleotidyltransferase
MPAPAQRIDAYVHDIVHAAPRHAVQLVSVILFGSAATGGYAGKASDVDLILVVADDTPHQSRTHLRDEVERLELHHGLRDEADLPANRVEAFARQITANVRSFFICTRDDLLSGDVARLLGISSLQARFVDRGVMPSIVRSARTAWGEDLLGQIPLLPIRRIDVIIALFGFWNQLMLTIAMYPLVPASTRYAMATLKRSVHNCYFCHHLRPAPLEQEVAFFRSRRPSRTLDQLMDLRKRYRRSLRFVLRCAPALLSLHYRTLIDNRFPRPLPTPRASASQS